MMMESDRPKRQEYNRDEIMSSLITMKLPFLDILCLKEAIKQCELTLTEQGAQIKLSNNIVFQQTTFGYQTQIAMSQQGIVNKIQAHYDRIYEKKMKELREKQTHLDALINHEHELKQRLEEMRSSTNTAVENYKEIENDLQNVTNSLNKTEKELGKDVLKIEKQKLEFKNNIINQIQKKAENKGYKIQKIQNQGKTQLVLVKMV